LGLRYEALARRANRKEGLSLLAEIAAADREAYFGRDRDWAAQYRGRLIATALCPSVALHLLNVTTGVQDFDVYSFYARHPDRPWCAIGNVTADFGQPRFGQPSLARGRPRTWPPLCAAS